MKTAKAILNIAAWCLIGIGILSLFARYYVIPGLLLWWVFRERYRGWMEAATALLVVLILRFSTGEWPMRIGGHSSGEWLVEVMLGIVSWAIGAILVNVGYNLARCLFGGQPDKTSDVN